MARIFIISMVLFSSCAPAAYSGWQNDPDVTAAKRRTENLEQNFQAYREGGTQPGSSKTGGGCGCN